MSYELSMNFYAVPHLASDTITSKQLKELMLKTSGKIFACGDMWSIKKESLGAGIYRINLVRSNRGVPSKNTEKKKSAKNEAVSSELKNARMALEHMINEYTKVTGTKGDDLPAFVTSQVKEQK